MHPKGQGLKHGSPKSNFFLQKILNRGDNLKRFTRLSAEISH